MSRKTKGSHPLLRTVKSKKIKVIPVCSVCGEPVAATQKDTAYRHGFKRYKTKMTTGKFSQEDAKPCSGSGQDIVYKRRTAK